MPNQNDKGLKLNPRIIVSRLHIVRLIQVKGFSANEPHTFKLIIVEISFS